jgi:hypothetical protein
MLPGRREVGVRGVGLIKKLDIDREGGRVRGLILICNIRLYSIRLYSIRLYSIRLLPDRRVGPAW